jgi:hypothetical protein
VFPVPISVERRGKNQPGPGQESVGDASVLSHGSLLRNPWPNPTGALEHCREGKTNTWFSIFVGVFF